MRREAWSASTWRPRGATLPDLRSTRAALALLAATVVALLWANSPWQDSYLDLWSASLSLPFVDLGPGDLRHWVNDGLMAVFFFAVGLEIKRELVVGELSSLRVAALPAIAALGGMVVPALVYLALNAGGDGASGWGVPIATDIAFAVGVLALLGDRVPTTLKVLVLALAVVDDIGAIVVIVVFYADDISAGWLAAGAAGASSVLGLRRAGTRWLPIYAGVGAVVWLAVFESGVHATLAGVALGLLTPARSPSTSAISVAERLELALHPWTSYAVLPLFALANAGVVLSSDALGDAAGSAVTIGVVLGLVVGKPVGVALAVWLAVRVGWARLPEGVGAVDIGGMAAAAGIGFTVSIFISGLAFDDAPLVEQATIGVLVGSSLAAIVAVLLLRPRWHERVPSTEG